jgi:photoactive yellow protein
MNKNNNIASFGQTNLLESLALLDSAQLDALPFGVIGFGKDCLVVQYNQFETDATGLARGYVLGKHLFTQIAQCMNNYMVAQRFENAWVASSALDHTLDYVLTWRMKPTKVKLRLLIGNDCKLAYIVLSPRSPMDT